MQKIDYFKFEDHEGEYDSWPLRSRLFFKGSPTKKLMMGYEVIAQFKIDFDRYLLIYDQNCPFDETTRIAILDNNFKTLSRREMGAGVGLIGHDSCPLDPNNLIVNSLNGEKYRIEVHRRRPFWLCPLISIHSYRS